jgi:hypothetical protein
MAARFDDAPDGPVVELRRKIALRLRLADARRPRSRSRRWLSWLLTGALLVTFSPCQEQAVRTDAAMPMLPVSRPLLATKPAPPPADRKDTAGNATRPTSAPAPKPPPVVVEMPPPIPGPPLALAAADPPGPPPRKPTPPARKLRTHAPPTVAASPAVLVASATAQEDAPSIAAFPKPAAVDPKLNAEETALILAHREQVAQALYRPGEWNYDGPTRSAAAAASASRKMPMAEEWTAVDTTGSPLPAAMPAAPIEVSYATRLAQPQTEAVAPTRLADLTPDEQRIILARRGVHEARPGIRVAINVKVLETEDPAQYLRSGSPAVPIDAPLPEVPAALLQQKGDWMMVARVHVARNGATDITITRPIDDSALNRAVDQALSRWRFRPSSAGYGQPEDSTIKLSVKVSVG